MTFATKAPPVANPAPRATVAFPVGMVAPTPETPVATPPAHQVAPQAAPITPVATTGSAPVHVSAHVTPPSGTPLPPAPIPRWSGSTNNRRSKSDSVADAFDMMTKPSTAPTNGTHVKHAASTASDLAAVRGVFNEVAAVHVAQVRDVMLELRYGEADPAWMESTRPALHSLRAFAAQMDLTDLVKALDEFCQAVESAVANRAKITEDDKTELLRRYQRLIELIPQAFELDAERDRREPVIIEALLLQIDGVERRTIDKLFAVGLNRLDALTHAKADEVEVVAGIRRELADKIVDKFHSYRAASNATVATRDPAGERRELADLLIMMSLQNDDFERVSNQWTDEARSRKRELRRQREQTYQRIKVSLARLGEKDQLARLEKLPFNERIQTLDRYLSAPRTS